MPRRRVNVGTELADDSLARARGRRHQDGVLPASTTSKRRAGRRQKLSPATQRLAGRGRARAPGRQRSAGPHCPRRRSCVRCVRPARNGGIGTGARLGSMINPPGSTSMMERARASLAPARRSGETRTGRHVSEELGPSSLHTGTSMTPPPASQRQWCHRTRQRSNGPGAIHVELPPVSSRTRRGACRRGPFTLAIRD